MRAQIRRALTAATLTTATLGAVLSGGLATAAAAPAPVQTQAPGPLQPVPTDLSRYLGTWNQLASIPAFFDVFCVRDTQARYSLNDDGTVRVQNRCAGPFGIPVPIEGTARVSDPVTTGALQVTFLAAFNQPVFLGGTNYVVAAHSPDTLDEDYTWALVGSPDRSTGFVLSRTPALDEAQWRTVLAAVTDAGFDPCRLNTTVTTGGLQTAQPLCTLDPSGR
ncbi:lipocalin family protein [Rhodococcus sp. X156]|uniref:lipocalin family protein n=1 Tax=Rhodococcus sp. X156 TaxID=2499145 RepID=UPI000FD71AC1|nr:lipocalin family protein [Rhodococcus sp. X156]